VFLNFFDVKMLKINFKKIIKKSIKRASGKKTRPLSALINLEAQGGGHTHCRESWASKEGRWRNHIKTYGDVHAKRD
jgi:hypothetical protein